MEPGVWSDHESQISRLWASLAGWGGAVREHLVGDPEACAREVGLLPRGAGEPAVVVGGDVGADLGGPGYPSHGQVLATRNPSLVTGGRILCVGPDLHEPPAAGGRSFVQLVVLRAPEQGEVDSLALGTTRFLAGRLEGFMVRAVPGRMWVRVSRDAIARGFRLETLGKALFAAYCLDHPQLEGVDILLATGPMELVRELEPVLAEARVVAGHNRKLILVEAGVYDCADLDCEGCDEQAICDALRDVSVRYRKRSA